MNSKRMRSGAIYLLLVIALGAFFYTSLVRRPATTIATISIGDVAAWCAPATRLPSSSTATNC